MKQLPRTPELIARLRAAFGQDADVDNLVAYEAVAANQLPLRKKRGLYQGARFSNSAMGEMVAAVGKESVALQIMHDDGVLPVGRVFAAAQNGDEVVCQFAINKLTQPQLVADIDAGVLDQVSVGMLPRQLMCSECDFDYLGEGATFENIYMQTCSNNHTIGENGVHARLIGCADWFELSLVGKGAVNGARIRSPKESVFASASSGAQRLAASGAGAALTCDAITAPTPKETPTMDKEVLAQLTAAIEGKTKAEAALASLTTERDTARAAFETANNNLTAAVKERDQAVADLVAAPSAADLKAAIDALKDHAKRVAVACGEQEPKVPEAVADLVAFINERNEKLTAVLSAGARSEAADQTAQSTPRGAGRAFSIRN